MKAETKTNNRLWQARHKAGLEQKQVARLLGHKNCDQISRYERGVRMPNLRTALKLELIYGTPISSLFPEHYGQYRSEIAGNTLANGLPPPPSTSGEKTSERLPDAHVCTYDNLLLKTRLTAPEIDAANKHTVRLIEKIADVIHRRRSSE